MSITKIREVPYELPHTHLYLDDIEDISAILLSSSQKARPSGQATITFSTGEVRMDSVQDLEKHGGSAKHFSIRIGSYGDGTVTLHGFSSPEIRQYSSNEEIKWATYGQVKAIFEKRQFRTKNIITRVPEWLQFTLWTFWIVIATPLLEILHAGNFYYGAWIVLTALLVLVIFSPSRVYFVRSHERSKLAKEARNGYVKAISLVALGGVITKLIDYFAPRLLK